MPEFHAKLSPSASTRWIICAGSVPLSAGMESKSSIFAQEGTDAHSEGETDLLGGARATSPAVLVYVDYVRSLLGPGTELYVEKRVKVTKDIEGTADAIVWDSVDETLYVLDYKNGSGVPVEVRGNTQLMIYGLGALLTTGHKPKTVVVGIIQPRCSHPDGPIRLVEYSAMDLLEFHDKLLDAAERVRDAENTYPSAPGMSTAEWEEEFLHPNEKACRWCLAAPKCPKVKATATSLATRVFSPLVNYDPAELAHTLDMLPVLEGWVKNVREFAYSEAEAGRPIPGYKLVEKRATRRWAESITDEYLSKQTGLDVTEITESKLLSPAAVEKLLGKGGKTVLEALTVKESSGHTLVHDTDKRDAVRVDAAGVFQPVIGN